MIAGATIITAVFARYLRNLIGPETIQKIVDYIDALGTPAFAVFGMQLAEEAGLPLMSIVFVGVANGVAGGLLRDVVVRDVPALLRPGQFASTDAARRVRRLPAADHRGRRGPNRAAWITVVRIFRGPRAHHPVQLADEFGVEGQRPVSVFSRSEVFFEERRRRRRRCRRSCSVACR